MNNSRNSIIFLTLLILIGAFYNSCRGRRGSSGKDGNAGDPNKNSPPISLNMEVTVMKGVNLITLHAVDPDGDPITFSIFKMPSQGILTLTDPIAGKVSYTPNSDYEGADLFSFIATDIKGASSQEAGIYLNVINNTGGGGGGTNTPPTAIIMAFMGAGREIRVDASRSFDKEDPPTKLSYWWDFQDDGTPEFDWTAYPVTNASWVYPSDGTYTIRLKVRDSGGLIGETRHIVVIETGGGGGTGGKPGAGELDWAVSSGGPGNDIVTGLSCYPEGKVACVGNIYGDVTFGSGSNQRTLFGNWGNPPWIMFLAIYESDGKLNSVRTLPGGGRHNASTVDVLADGSLIVTGSFMGDIRFSPTLNLTSNSGGIGDIYLIKYRPNFTIDWAKFAGGATKSFIEQDVVYDVAIANDQSFFVVGKIYGNGVFGMGEPNQTTLREGEYLAKYNFDGTLNWALNLSDPGSKSVAGFMDGSCLVGGESLSKFSSSGQRLSLLQGRGGKVLLFSDESYVVLEKGVFQPNTYLVKYNSKSDETWRVDLGSWDNFYFDKFEDGSIVLSRPGCLLLYTVEGKKVWEKKAWEGPIVVCGNNFFLAGEFSGTIILGQGEPNEIALRSNGKFDLFVSKFK